MSQSSFLYQEIAESLRRRIVAGELQPGDKLPPVRAMAGQWQCTPGTVSRAYAALAQEGLVTSQRGSGTRVTAVLPTTEAGDTWQWATLVNRAEQYLLEAVQSGHPPSRAEAALRLAIARWQEMQQQDAPVATAVPRTSLRLAASHDLTLGFLARLLEERAPDVALEIEYVGSLGGLMALARQEADAAGTHLWDEATDTYNLPFVQRVLPGQPLVLLTLARRSLGLMAVPGNPHQLQGLPELARPEIRFINRQPGSGTRVWLDAQLKAMGMATDTIQGYEKEVTTHMAVAYAIKQREADAGLGIYAAAAAYGLAFLPLTYERYELVFPKSVWQKTAVQSLVSLIRSDRFKESVAALGGYDTTETGAERWV